MSVLVVDDDESIFDLVVDLLQATAPGQYSPHWTTSYDEALQALQNPAVDVALIDYHLGTTNGLQLIGELTASTSNVPLILLTGQGGRELDSAALEAGATDYLDKATLSGPLLDRSLRYAIGRRRAAEELQRSDERFRALFANSPAAIYIVNLTTGLVEDVNAEFEQLRRCRRSPVLQTISRFAFRTLSPAAARRLSEAFSSASTHSPASVVEWPTTCSRPYPVRRTVIEPSVIDLNELVRNTETLLRRLLGTDMMLTLHLASNLSAVRADAALLEQAIVNLALNARDAMPSGGHLDIESVNVMLDEAFAADHHGLTVGPYVSIAVADTGTGMDETVKARVFEPFFTTKGPGEGTGLGLAMVYGAVTQSGGSISVQSQVGLGSTFTIYLPTSDQPLTQDESTSDSESRGTETVLVVEDQDDVRELVGELLRRSGYTVIMAANPHEALGILTQPHTEISLLLTDVVMPHMNGRELASICRATQPGLRVLYMSGYTNDALGHRGLLDPGIALIHKPFAGPVLLQRVRAVLDAPERGTVSRRAE